MAELYAGYAVNQKNTKGRRFRESPHPYRSPFERDRDRIIHCEAFRRLEGKTQVFTPGLNDSYRNRLTHSIEVAQIGRTIAKLLKVNQNLTEAICLAHDLGHPPFGHTGEKVLDEIARDFGGFDHNKQGLRVVDLIEHPYPGFRGLNLTYETRQGLAFHKGPYDKPDTDDFSETNCSLEAQIANIADQIAYTCHDLEDAMRAGLITEKMLQALELFRIAGRQIGASRIDDFAVRKTRTAKKMIDILVTDCINTSQKKIMKVNPRSLDDVYKNPEVMVVLSQQEENMFKELQNFLLENFYLHTSLKAAEKSIVQGMKRLFEKLSRKTQIMPKYYQRLLDSEGLEKTLIDYISGMTDRYCFEMIEKL